MESQKPGALFGVHPRDRSYKQTVQWDQMVGGPFPESDGSPHGQ